MLGCYYVAVGGEHLPIGNRRDADKVVQQGGENSGARDVIIGMESPVHQQYRGPSLPPGAGRNASSGAGDKTASSGTTRNAGNDEEDDGKIYLKIRCEFRRHQATRARCFPVWCRGMICGFA